VGTLTKFAPIVAAVSYVIYVVASGNTAQIPTAISALLAALGYQSAKSAHEKIEKL
jgi:hypothetical protein